MIVFSAGFPRDFNELAEIFKNRMIKYFTRLGTDYLTWLWCSKLFGGHRYLRNRIYEPEWDNNSCRTSQCRKCKSMFGGDEVLRYSVNEITREKIEEQSAAEDPSFFSAPGKRNTLF